MIHACEGQYTKEEAEQYWRGECLIPNLENPPPPGRDWFSLLFGFSEASYAESKKWLQVSEIQTLDPASGKMMTTQTLLSSNSKANGMEFKVGRFTCPKLGEIREKAKSVAGNPGSERQLRVTNELGDVAEKINYPENAHATFQVASQFNCLEFTGPDVVPEDGVAGYARDRTQGPACSIACGAATVYRNYFAKVPDQGVHDGQTRGCMLNNLKHFDDMIGNGGNKYFNVQGGYSQSEDAKLQLLNRDHLDQRAGENHEAYPERLATLRDAIAVGHHQDIEVTSSEWGVKLNGKQQTCTQVFASALAVGYQKRTQPKSWEKFAILVLEATYEATLCAGLLAKARHGGRDGSNRVFLTSVGGGVFGNPMEWIVPAMSRACEQFKNYDLDVRVVTYAGEVDPLLQRLAEEFF